MRKIARWTISSELPCALECLNHSIELWRTLYPDFEIFVCHNGINPPKIEATLINQEEYQNTLPIRPKSTIWKFIPPRIDLMAHEIFIDNDLVIYDKIPSLKTFLKGNFCISTSAYQRYYGQFHNYISKNIYLNSGLFGLPPKFNFKEKIEQVIKFYHISDWVSHTDDEGLLALCTKKTLQTIPIEDIRPCNPSLTPYLEGSCGMHFIELNQGKTDYWNLYKLKRF